MYIWILIWVLEPGGTHLFTNVKFSIICIVVGWLSFCFLLCCIAHISLLDWQIDELVVKALELKEIDKQGRKEIESFTHVLSDMQSSLKVIFLGRKKHFIDAIEWGLLQTPKPQDIIEGAPLIKVPKPI